MIIYVVQPGDTITSIADVFGVSVFRMINENGLQNAADLVVGQTIVITYPLRTHVVKEGDILSDIAASYEISITQLYRNNPFLWERDFIYPEEELIVSYNTNKAITVNAYAFPFIEMNILKKTLPYLTYLSILNYKTLRRGAIESFYDDSEIIKTAKQFGVAPLMLITSVSFRGERNPEMVYEILLKPEYQENHARNMLKVVKEKGYYGVNITFTYLNETNQELYLNYLRQVSSYLNKEGYPVFITIDPNFEIDNKELRFESIDYSGYNDLIEGAYIMSFFWGTQYGPPIPVSSIKDISVYLNYTKQTINPQKLSVGFPVIGYDWALPYIPNFSSGNAIALDACIELARLMKAVILFDEESKTPYFEYTIQVGKEQVRHIVWFVDARTINAVSELIIENGLQGSGLWNIMSYFPQLWLVINSNFSITKLLPELD